MAAQQGTGALVESLRAHLEISVHEGKWADCVRHASQIAICLGDNPQAAAIYVSQAQVYASMAAVEAQEASNATFASALNQFGQNGAAMVRLKAEHNSLVDESLKPMRGA